MNKYEIQTFTLSHGWTSTDGELFDTFDDARRELKDFLDNQAEAYFNGYMEDLYNKADWRVKEVVCLQS